MDYIWNMKKGRSRELGKGDEPNHYWRPPFSLQVLCEISGVYFVPISHLVYLLVTHYAINKFHLKDTKNEEILHLTAIVGLEPETSL